LVDAIDVVLDFATDVNLPGPTGENWDATPLQPATDLVPGERIELSRPLRGPGF
jgi:hypothetical protein